MKTPEKRFWDKVDTSGGPDACWEWRAARQQFGHGLFRVDGKLVKAHRFSYELHKFRIPEGVCVCHRCDNPSCVNPAHLFLGTKGDNNRDRDRKGRHQTRKGSDHGMSKLTEKDVREILIRHAAGASQASLAREYQVSTHPIYAIVNRKEWRHVHV